MRSVKSAAAIARARPSNRRASRPPLPRRQVADARFGQLTGSVVRALAQREIAAASALSLSGVPVPWALT